MADMARGRFLESIRGFTGQRCWSVGAGEGTGSRFTLDVGGGIKRPFRIQNELLSPRSREYTGEYSLFVQNCPWRLASEQEVVTSWADDNANDGPLVGGLDRLVDVVVVSAEATPPSWDLTMRFANGLVLEIFADGTPRTDDDDYIVFAPGVVFGIGRGGRIVIAERDLEEVVDLKQLPAGEQAGDV